MGISHYVHFNFCGYYFVHDTVQDTFCSYFTGIYANCIHSPAFLYNLFVLDTLSSDFSRQPVKQGSFGCPCQRLRTINPKSTDNNHYLYYCHETYIWMRIKHDTCWSSRTTPYLHPHLPNDLKGKKLRYHQQGKKL